MPKVDPSERHIAGGEIGGLAPSVDTIRCVGYTKPAARRADEEEYADEHMPARHLCPSPESHAKASE
jgi:hypothetical protein